MFCLDTIEEDERKQNDRIKAWLGKSLKESTKPKSMSWRKIRFGSGDSLTRITNMIGLNPTPELVNLKHDMKVFGKRLRGTEHKIWVYLTQDMVVNGRSLNKIVQKHKDFSLNIIPLYRKRLYKKFVLWYYDSKPKKGKKPVHKIDTLREASKASVPSVPNTTGRNPETCKKSHRVRYDGPTTQDHTGQAPINIPAFHECIILSLDGL